MSLRDFNTNTENTPTFIHAEPVGDGAGLGHFHTVNPEDREPNNTPKIVGALAVALMIGAAGVYAYTASGDAARTKTTVVAAANPQAVAPPPAAAPAMMPEATTDTASTAMTPAAAPVSTPEPVKQAAIKPSTQTATQTPTKAATKTASSTSAPSQATQDGASARMAAAEAPASAPAPVEQAAITPTPLAPAPSPSDVASVGGPSVSVPAGATSAQDMPTPQQSPDPSVTTPAAPSDQAGSTPQSTPVQ